MMKPQIYWDTDNSQILWVRFEHPFTMDTYIQTVNAGIAEVRNSAHHVDVIFYVDAALPSGNFIPVLREILMDIKGLDNLGMVVSVYPNQNVFMTFATMIIDSVLRIYNSDLKAKLPFVRTVEEAYSLIKISQAKSDIPS